MTRTCHTYLASGTHTNSVRYRRQKCKFVLERYSLHFPSQRRFFRNVSPCRACGQRHFRVICQIKPRASGQPEGWVKVQTARQRTLTTVAVNREDVRMIITEMMTEYHIFPMMEPIGAGLSCCYLSERRHCKVPTPQLWHPLPRRRFGKQIRPSDLAVNWNRASRTSTTDVKVGHNVFRVFHRHGDSKAISLLTFVIQ
jgi:hypothetical protein